MMVPAVQVTAGQSDLLGSFTPCSWSEAGARDRVQREWVVRTQAGVHGNLEGLGLWECWGPPGQSQGRLAL